MTKGFVLTLDAVLAAIVALIISILIMSMLSISTINYYEKQGLRSVGNDLLAVLDLTDRFDDYTDMSISEANADLLDQLNILPEHYCAKISVRVFHHNSGFVLDKRFYATKTNCITETEDELTKVRRIYVDFDDQKYGSAEMELWLK